MNDFLYEEILAAEHRRNHMKKAAQYNQFNTPTGKSYARVFTVSSRESAITSKRWTPEFKSITHILHSAKNTRYS